MNPIAENAAYLRTRNMGGPTILQLNHVCVNFKYRHVPSAGWGVGDGLEGDKL